MAKLRLIHQWVGLLLSIVIFAVAVSGAVLLFSEDLHRAVHPILAEPVTASLADYPDVLRQFETNATGAAPTLIKFPQPGMNVFQLWFNDDSEAFIHPGNGEIIAHWYWHETLPSLLYELHSNLLAGERGELINGGIAFAVLFLAGSGVLLWWQHRNYFKLRFVVPYHFSSASILRNHAALGVTGMMPIILFVSTGFFLVFYKPAALLLTNLLDDRPPGRPDVVIIPDSKPMMSWEQILAGVEKTFPGGRLVFYYPPNPDNAAMVFRKRLPGEWHPNGRSYIVVDPYQGEVVQAIDARREQPGARIMNIIYPLHAARIGGPVYKSIALLSAITLALLAGTGIISYGLGLIRTARRHGPY